MAYPQYLIEFIAKSGTLSTGERTNLTSVPGVDGSHTHSLVLDDLQIEVRLTHHDEGADLFPNLVITYTKK